MRAIRRSRTGSLLATSTLSLFTLLAACGDDAKNAPPDTGVVVDTGVIDTGVHPDANVEPDAGSEDARVVTDTGVLDGDPAPPDVGPPDLGVPDSGVEVDSGVVDSGLPDSGPPDSGAIVPPCPCTFTEDFTTTARVDSALTTATVDTTNSGVARVAAPRSFEAIGLGTEGAFLADGTNTLTPGAHDLTTFTVDSGNPVEVTGDLDLSLTGDFRVVQEAYLHVLGNLTIRAGGAVIIDCATVEVAGDIVIHQPGTGGVRVACPTFPTARLTTSNRGMGEGSSGNLTIWTRGGLVIGNSARVQTGNIRDTTATVGSIEIRAYEDVELGPADAYLFTGDTWGTNGDIGVYTEGQIVVDEASYVKAGQALGITRAGGSITLHARGLIEVNNQSYVVSAPGGAIDVRTEDVLRLSDDGYVLSQSGGTAPTLVHLRGRSVELTGAGSASAGGYVLAGESQAGGGAVHVEARDQVSLDGASTIGSSDAHCAVGGSVTVESGGVITLGGSAQISGGASVTGTACRPLTGGAAVVRARGPINVPPTGVVGGAGATAGAVLVSAFDPSYHFGALDAELTAASAVVSVPLALEANVPRVVTSATVGPTTPAMHTEVFVFASPDGAQAALPADQLPSPLVPGAWRYELRVQPRMFDEVTVEGFDLHYQ